VANTSFIPLLDDNKFSDSQARWNELQLKKIELLRELVTVVEVGLSTIPDKRLIIDTKIRLIEAEQDMVWA
jgi:hypothetical protein